MSLHRCFDAAYPPSVAPDGFEAVLGYLGGGRALNVWTVPQWLVFHQLRQFPCWVPPIGSDPKAEAASAVAAAVELGWAADMPLGETRVIIGDLETEHDAAWWKAFSDGVMSGGFLAVAYGSISTIGGNLASDVWVADFDNVAQLVPGQTVHAKQDQADVWLNNSSIDISVIDEWMFARGGRGARH